MAQVSCQNCDWTGDESECDGLPEAEIFDRVGPGEIMPVGECTKCGAVCHYDRPPDIPEGGAFDVRTGPAGDDIGQLIGRPCGEYETAERIAERYRKPGQWARVEEFDAFTNGPGVLWLPAALADVIGGQQIQQLANRFAKPILTKPGGRCSHAGFVYWPEG